MTTLAPAPAWRGWVRRHERTLAAGWLAAVALLLLALAFAPTRRAILFRVQGLSDRWDARWTARLARGDSLLAAGRNAEATAYLERLDAVFPARNVRHVRDKQREHLLTLLARSYEAEGRTGRAMAAWNRLVAFDSLNYYNHFLRAQAAERLLSGWAVAPEARDGFASALKINPNHLPSVRGFIQFYSDRSDWRAVVTAFDAYLDAFLVQSMTIDAGDTAVSVMVPVDGRPHAVSLVLRGAAQTARLSANGFAFAVDSATAMPPARVGVAAARAARALEPGMPAGLDLTASGAYRPTGDSSALDYRLADAGPGTTLTFVVRLFKPVDAALWDAVFTSHTNILDPAGRAADRARVVLYPDAASADAVLEHLPSARDGLPPRAATP